MDRRTSASFDRRSGPDSLIAYGQCRTGLSYRTVFFLRDFSRTMPTSVANAMRRARCRR